MLEVTSFFALSLVAWNLAVLCGIPLAFEGKKSHSGRSKPKVSCFHSGQNEVLESSRPKGGGLGGLVELFISISPLEVWLQIFAVVHR